MSFTEIHIQWRIQDFLDGGGGLQPSTPNGVPTYYLANFFRRRHENEEILVEGPASLRPLGSFDGILQERQTDSEMVYIFKH